MAEDTVVLHVNGERIEVKNPDPSLSLAKFLRQDLHLKGTKIACGVSGCGSCTVTVTRPSCQDERQQSRYGVYSCGIKLWTLHGSHVTTIEAVGSTTQNDGLHPLQEQLHRKNGVQCGFCSPGMIMAVHSKLGVEEAAAAEDIEDVSKCLAGNLCRCTGYRSIVEGFETALSTSEAAAMAVPKLQLMQKEEIPGLNLNNICHAPKDLEAVLHLMRSHRGNFEFVQGGTGHYGIDKAAEKNVKIFLGLVDSLQEYEIRQDEVVLGAAMKLADVERVLRKVSFCQPFCSALQTLGSPQVRGQATVGGAIMWPHPASDLWPLFLVYQCQVTLHEADARECAIVDVDKIPQDFAGLILNLRVKKPNGDYYGGFRKKARRKEFDLAIVNMAGLMERHDDGIIRNIRLAFGSSVPNFQAFKGPRTSSRMAESTMRFLQGKRANEVEDNDLESAIKVDLATTTEKLKLSLATHFVQSFLKREADDVSRPKKRQIKATHVFTEVSPEQPANDLVHRPVPHLWGAELASGKALFIDDLRGKEDEHVIVLVRSERSHAKIKRLDFTEALSQKGILGVVSSDDLPGERNLWGLMVNDEDVFARETVKYHGQIIAGLVCQTEEQGQEALKLIKIEYEDLPFVLNLKHAKFVLGKDLDKDLEVCVDKVVIERKQLRNSEKEATIELKGSLRIGAAEHFYMEPHSVLAIPLVEKNELEVHHSTQEVTTTQTKIALALALPQHKVIVKNKRAGGGFGGKERMHEAIIASLAAHKFKKPMRLIFTRHEDMALTGHRHESLLDYQVLVEKATGRILEADFKAWANAGSSTDLSFFWVMILLLRIDGGYTLKNFKAVGKAVKTNSPSNTAFRGFGGPEGAFYIETILDRIAHELNMSVLKVQEANLTREGDLLHHSHSRLRGCTLEKCWKLCLEKSNFHATLKENEAFNLKSGNKKRGLAITPIKFPPGMGAKEAMKGSAMIRVYQDGSVLLTHGGIEMGQGLHTKMIQVASRTLGIDPCLIHINEVSTETLANTSPTGGSCGTDINGPAVIDACQQIMAKLEPYKSSGSWPQIVEAALNDRVCLTVIGHYDQSPLDYNPGDQSGDAFAYLTYGACAVQAEVDCVTGDVSILRVELVMDLGKSLNPGIDIGQIEGAFLMGLGNVTSEQLVRDLASGKLLTDGPSHYKIPGVADIPEEIHVTLLEDDTERPTSAVYSSKGVGEPPICASAAVCLAIKEAVMSYRKQVLGVDEWFSLEPPCTPEKIVLLAKNIEDSNKSYIEM